MLPIPILHNAARHYCIERISYWHQRYAALYASGKHRDITRTDSLTYTSEAYDMFPRYNLLAAILSDIEHYAPADFSSLEKLREVLILAAETAMDDNPKQNRNPIESAAQTEERQLFSQYITSWDPQSSGNIPQLPHRRILADDEHKRWHQAFEQHWGKWYGGHEGRIANGIHIKKENSPPHVTLHTQAMECAGAYDHLRAALSQKGITRLLELREWGDGVELDLCGVNFQYTGAEGFWMMSDLSWMIYASHESSITFGSSWLIEAMRASLPEFNRYIYKSWALEDYPSP